MLLAHSALSSSIAVLVLLGRCVYHWRGILRIPAVAISSEVVSKSARAERG